MCTTPTEIWQRDPRGSVPFCGAAKCYACDAKPVGYSDRTHSPEGELVPACKRHADPTIKIFAACCLCLSRVRNGSLSIESEFVHAKCQREASK